MYRTPEEIRTKGLAALKRELGAAGMIRFLHQFDRGNGDWATERHAWAEKLTWDDIRKAAEKLRRRKKKNSRGG
jgi:hypothetical protein